MLITRIDSRLLGKNTAGKKNSKAVGRGNCINCIPYSAIAVLPINLFSNDDSRLVSQSMHTARAGGNIWTRVYFSKGKKEGRRFFPP